MQLCNVVVGDLMEYTCQHLYKTYPFATAYKHMSGWSERQHVQTYIPCYVNEALTGS